MRLILAVASVAVLALASSADAQVFPRRSTGPQYQQQNCPGGVCPAVPGAAIANSPFTIAPTAAPIPFGQPPTPNHEWGMTDLGPGWKLKAVALPQKMESPVAVTVPDPTAVPAPKFVEAPSSARDRHGRLFYRRVVDQSYFGLVNEKGMDRTRARLLVESLSHESIDTYGDAVGIKAGIGDGKLLDWLYEHREQIIALVKLIISLLAVAEAQPPHQRYFAEAEWFQLAA